MKCALIMAGGRGTRFWPMSTDEKPKQFLRLLGNKTMLQMTVERISKAMPLENIFICTGEKYQNLVHEQVPELSKMNIIIEPEGRNTAPCILLSTLYIKEIRGETSIMVLPSDHMINMEDTYIDILQSAAQYLDEKNAIITLGIAPDRPETGYGYIKVKEFKENFFGFDYYSVNQFKEKPNLELAKKYVSEGGYYWNAGMFLFNTEYMINEFKTHFPQCYKVLCKLPKITDATYMGKLKELYKQCEAISIDYAIMEKTNELLVIPCDFGWDDIGTWASLERYMKKDINNNMAKGNVDFIQSHSNIVINGDTKIVMFDVDDILVVESKDMTIITKKENINKIVDLRNMYEKL